MSEQFNRKRITGVTGIYHRSCLGAKEPLAHPKNCRHECPYGYGRAFCFPCYAKIMNEHRAARRQDKRDEGLAGAVVLR